jgi:probable F420-dependent oxidoreductase
MTDARMRVGVVLPIGEDDAGGGIADYPAIRDVAIAAEAGGFDSVWVFDHLLYRFDGETTGIHECWTILSAIAEATSRVQLGTIVMCTAFRNPALLAKMAATLDHVSGGRLILGVGTGWHEPEFDAFGFPFDHRVGRFEESLAVITGLIRDGRADLSGRWVTVRDVVLRPPARPDLPILVAAKGPRMLDLTARHADAWNAAWFGLPDERLAGRRRDLVEACERTGRDPATISVTVGLIVRYPEMSATAASTDPPTSPGLSGSPEEIAAGLRAHAEAGADHAIVVLEPCTPETVGLFAEALAVYRAD